MTSNHKSRFLCKWIDIKFKPCLKSYWIINSSFEFVENLEKFQPMNIDICATFYIKGFYTNVPLEKTINKITKVYT